MRLTSPTELYEHLPVQPDLDAAPFRFLEGFDSLKRDVYIIDLVFYFLAGNPVPHLADLSNWKLWSHQSCHLQKSFFSTWIFRNFNDGVVHFSLNYHQTDSQGMAFILVLEVSRVSNHVNF